MKNTCPNCKSGTPDFRPGGAYDICLNCNQVFGSFGVIPYGETRKQRQAKIEKARKIARVCMGATVGSLIVHPPMALAFAIILAGLLIYMRTKA